MIGCIWHALGALQWRSQGGARGAMAPPKLLLNVFFWNELMSRPGKCALIPVSVVNKRSINAAGPKMYQKCAGTEGMRLICEREKFLLLPPPPLNVIRQTSSRKTSATTPPPLNLIRQTSSRKISATTPPPPH